MSAPARVHPFRRFFARQIDNVIALLVAMAAAYLWDEAMLRTSLAMDSAAFAIPTLLVWVVIESGLLRIGWSTPGKWLFALQVRPLNCDRPSFRTALDRSFTVLAFGQGGCLPILSWYAAIQSYRDLDERGATSWDRDRFVVEAMPFGALRAFVCLALFLLLCLVMIALILS